MSAPPATRSAPTTSGLADRLLESGRVEFFPGCEVQGDGRSFVSHVSGVHFTVSDRCRVVDARYLSPRIPAESARPSRLDPARGSCPSISSPTSTSPRASTSSSGRARPRPTRACGSGARRGSRRDLLGTPSRPVDAEPGGRAARSRDLPRDGRRHDAGGGGLLPGRPLPPARSAGVMLRIERVPPTMARTPTRHVGARPAAIHRERVRHGTSPAAAAASSCRRLRHGGRRRSLVVHSPARGPDAPLAPGLEAEAIRRGADPVRVPLLGLRSSDTSRRPRRRCGEEPDCARRRLRRLDGVGANDAGRALGRRAFAFVQPSIGVVAGITLNPARSSRCEQTAELDVVLQRLQAPDTGSGPAGDWPGGGRIPARAPVLRGGRYP